MRAATASVLVTVSVASHGLGVPAAASDDPPARFTVTTRKAEDTVAVGGDRERTTFDVRSPSGIGRAVIGRTGDPWPKGVVVRLHLKGLEHLTVSAGTVAVGAAVGAAVGVRRQGRGPTMDAGPGRDAARPGRPPAAGGPAARHGREGGRPRPARRRVC